MAAWRLSCAVVLSVALDASLAVALGCALFHWTLIRRRERASCFRAFLHNHWLGLAVFAGVALDYAVRLRAWPRAL